jgi:hypothetical protein
VEVIVYSILLIKANHMEKIDVLIWEMVGGFAGTWAIMFYMLKQIGTTRNESKQDIGSLRNELKQDLGKLDEKLTDVDRRLCRLEGAFSSKDFCVLKDQRYQGEKVE